MTMTIDSTLKEHHLVLFGGQGSPSIFSPYAATIIHKDTQSVNAGNILLSKCHAAFLEEIESLDVESRQDLAIDISLFGSPRDLLKPTEEYHNHPVLQATTIYLSQLIHYVAETLVRNLTYEHSFGTLQAAAGFSSGILPAVVVARASSLDEFVTSGVQGFRVAFWISCRTYFCTIKSTRDTADVVENHVNSAATLSLVTRGLSEVEVEQKLSHYYAHEQGLEQVRSPKGARRIVISAISSSGPISVSGPSADLCAFQAFLQTTSDLTATFAHVHGWYHGGSQLEAVVLQVLEDLSRRAISFPPCSKVMKPIYSTLDGTLFDGSTISSEELLTWLTRHLLIHWVNWRDTAREIAVNIHELLKREACTTVNILCFGPSSGSIFPELNPLDHRVTLLDLSPFKSEAKPRPVSVDPNDVDPHDVDPNDVAIVGMSVRLPRGKDTEQLWETISQGLNAAQEIPENRFEISDFYTTDVDKSRSMPVKHGAFLDDPFTFDNSFFNVSPREAKSMDPQQRILLHTAQEALEDAGYVPDSSPSFQRATIGCYIGVATGDYTDNLHNDIDTFYSSGTLRAFHSGRISYFFRFSGPSIVTDTACSSSTVSIYQAFRALQNGDCTTAIAGGVNVITSPDMYLGLARGHFLNQTGGCKPFDEAADGYCRAEGCVLFVLKRLSDAIVEGDRIHGVIKNVLVNQSGNSHSITHPHSQTQTDLLRRLLLEKDVDPGSIGVIEAHGTGTQAGDAREIETLRTFFGPHHSVTNPLMISSIKGNISHCEAASGAAGLAKLLLMLRERKIPIQAGLSNINPVLGDMQSSGLIIPRRTISWSHSKKTPRRAVLNNFGAAGSNASLLLEDWVLPSETQVCSKQQNLGRSAYPFALSAKSEKALKSVINRHIEFLRSEKRRPSLVDVCYTATARRFHHDHRISLACSSLADLLTRLQNYRFTTSMPAKPITNTVFVFTGQGALYRGMGQELMRTSSEFRDIIMDCDRIIQKLRVACPSIINYIICNDQNPMDTLTDLEQNMVSQCACVALEYALARIFISWDIIPDYLIGHSLGEYAALCVSGALTLEDTFRIVASRAKLQSEKCLANTSGMLACNLSAEEIESMLSESPALENLTIACLNSPKDCVIGGPLAQLDTFQRDCQTCKVKTKLINVPYAFHTSAMDPILEPLRALGRSIRVRAPTIPVMSNVSGRLFQNDLSSDYFADHARNPVRFSEGVLNIQQSMGETVLDGALFLEIGPQPTLLPMLQNSIPSNSCAYLGTLRRGKDAWTSISETLAAISLRKTAVKWREVFSGTSAKVTSLPGHILEGSKFIVPFQEFQSPSRASKPEDSERVKTGHSLLPWMNKNRSSSKEFVLETDMTILASLISGHDVGGTPICPASVFHELAVEAAQALLQPSESHVLIVSEMSFASPLVYIQPSEDALPTIVDVRVSKQSSSSSNSATFEIMSYSSTKGAAKTLHCTGSVFARRRDTNTSHWERDQAIVARQSRYFSGAGKENTSTFRTKTLYESIFTRVVRYSAEYQSLVYLDVADSNLEGFGLFKIPPGSGYETHYVVHPVFTDTLLHAAGFIANLSVGPGEICICAAVESIEIAYLDVDHSESFTIYCSLLEIKGAILADAIALSSSGKVIAVVRGMEFKKLQLSTFRQVLSRISDNSFTKSRGRESVQDQNVAPPKLELEKGVRITPMSAKAGSFSPTEQQSDSLFQAGISKVLKDIIMEVGGFAEQDIDYTKSLGDLGIDSLMQIEMASKLSRLFPGQSGLNHYALSQCETLEAIDDMLLPVLQSSTMQKLNGKAVHTTEREVSTPQGSYSHSTFTTASASSDFSNISDTMRDSNVIPATLHVSNGSQIPLYLFHDGSGQVSMYARLRGHDRTTYAFYNPHFGSGTSESTRPFYNSVNQMAELYVSAILSNPEYRSSSLILGGWSFGGVVAFEAAQQLMSYGLQVKGLVLIDSPCPVDHEPLPAAIISRITGTSLESGDVVSNSSNSLEKEFLSNAYLLGSYKPTSFRMVTGGRLKTVMLRCKDVLDTEALWGISYDWLSQQDTRTSAVVAWEELVGGHIEVLSIPGNHFEPFSQDKIDKTAAQLWKACQFLDGSGDADFDSVCNSPEKFNGSI